MKIKARGKILTGMKFGHVTVISPAFVLKGRSYWNCKCDCGKDVIFCRRKFLVHANLKNNLSCGCVPKLHHKSKAAFEESLRYSKIRIAQKIHNVNDCKIWDGVCRDGIPSIRFLDSQVPVKYLIYFIENLGKKIDLNFKIVTTCKNKKCININHFKETYYGKPNKTILRLYNIQKNRGK